MVIDVHAHYVPTITQPEFRSLFEVRTAEDGVRQAYVLEKSNGPLDDGLIDLALQIADMDACGIDFRLLCVMPFVFHYEHKNARAWSEYVNDTMAAQIGGYKGRFGILGILPMMDVKAACSELRRIMQKPGFFGVQIATNIAGMDLGDPVLDPFWKTAMDCEAFVLLHPHYTIEVPRLQKDFLRNLVGNPLDTMLAAFSLWRGGVFERYPLLRICLSHAGGYFPFAAGRFDKGFFVRNEFSKMPNPPSSTLEHFYCDTIQHDPEALRFVFEKTGLDHMLMGTDYPFTMGDLDPLASIQKLGLTQQDQKAVLGGTAKALLRL